MSSGRASSSRTSSSRRHSIEGNGAGNKIVSSRSAGHRSGRAKENTKSNSKNCCNQDAFAAHPYRYWPAQTSAAGKKCLGVIHENTNEIDVTATTETTAAAGQAAAGQAAAGQAAAGQAAAGQ